jgi:glycosyltransferase involved in cell wall biosynthesis
MSWLARRRFAATPLHARPTQVRRAFGRTALGVRLKRLPLRRPGPTSARAVPRRASGSGRNVLLISHCDFTGASAYHVHSIARELARLGWSPAVAVPGSTRGAAELGRAEFPILSYRAVRRGRLGFRDGRGIDLVHAFTPRPVVRSLALELGAPYVVHLEDNETAVRAAVRGVTDAAAEEDFLGNAAGITVVIDKLLELKPESVPGAVVWPGYDESLDRPGRDRDEVKRGVGLGADELAVVYTGNVHEANADEVGELYRAVSNLRADGHPVVLVKSGWNSVSRRRLPRLGRGLRDLGWIRRDRALELIRAADVLVQPGHPGPFDDYRFPSKLPDYLASGYPVITPRTNIGLELADGLDALLLVHGDAAEIASAVARVFEDAEEAQSIGGRGRAFAQRSLRWSLSVPGLATLYEAARSRVAGVNSG